MKNGTLTTLLAMLVIMGCSGIKVSQDYDPATDFRSLQTFRWATPSQEKTGDPRIDNPLRDTRIRAAITRLLTDKGFTLAEDDTPTFLVRYQYLLRQKIESNGTSGGIGFGIGSYGSHGGIAIGTGNRVREYDEGSLVVDILDAATDMLLWRGTGTQRFREYDNPAKTSADIDALVGKVLEPFPPIDPK
jgi:hypothetical protein